MCDVTGMLFNCVVSALFFKRVKLLLVIKVSLLLIVTFCHIFFLFFTSLGVFNYDQTPFYVGLC